MNDEIPYTANRLLGFAESYKEDSLGELLTRFANTWRDDENTLEALKVENEKLRNLLDKRTEHPRTFSEYQEESRKTKIYNDESKIIYPALGLVGESGEVANTVKKLLRDGELDVSKLISELGDVLWYISNLAYDIEITLDDIAWINIRKLRRRAEEGKLGGSGSER